MKIKISYFHIDNMSSLAFSEINSNDNLTGDNMNEFEKKRQTRHNITIKKRNTQNSGTGSGSDDNGNVQTMLKLINNTNGYDDTNDESGGLADFNPPPRAEVSSKTPPQSQQPAPQLNKEIAVDYEKPTQINIKKENMDTFQNSVTAVKPRQYPMPLDGQNDFASLPKTYASDYYKQYVPYFNSKPENSNNYSMANNKDQLLEKLNYMIHLLEEQKDEKTGHVMEEVILYSFLGVFIIFIVDSFSRGGKYTR
jgi:hypothetical protein